MEASAWRARLAAELDPGNRIGPEKLWAKFDEALDQLGIALEGDGCAELAALLGSLSAAATRRRLTIDGKQVLRDSWRATRARSSFLRARRELVDPDERSNTLTIPRHIDTSVFTLPASPPALLVKRKQGAPLAPWRLVPPGPDRPDLARGRQRMSEPPAIQPGLIAQPERSWQRRSASATLREVRQ